MDAAPAEAVTRVDRALMGVEPLVERQQAGVDVEHPVGPASDEIVAEDAHIARKRDIVGASGTQPFVDQRVEGGARHSLVRLRPDRNAFGRGEREARRFRVVARDQYEFIRAVGGLCGIEQRRHIGPGARDEDADFRFRHGATLSIRSC